MLFIVIKSRMINSNNIITEPKNTILNKLYSYLLFSITKTYSRLEKSVKLLTKIRVY